MSVKVPPTSTATRRFCTTRLPFEHAFAMLDVGRDCSRIYDPVAANGPFDQQISEVS